MAENVIYVRGRNARQRVVTVIRNIAGAATGRVTVPGDAQDALMVRMGLTALGFIKTAFITKSQGGTDDAGDSWAKLKRSTVAYSRRHPGAPARVRQPPSARAALAPSAILTAKQRERWWAIYRSLLGQKPSGAAYHAKVNQGNDFAAARAWIILKSEGAKTIIGEYGDAPVMILRDKGFLLNSLSPGYIPSQAKPPVPPPEPEGEGGENQVFKFKAGEVILGTNRKHAITHHEGRGHNPKRRLWPEPSKWPSKWWQGIAEQGRLGVIDIMLSMLR